MVVWFGCDQQYWMLRWGDMIVIHLTAVTLLWEVHASCLPVCLSPPVLVNTFTGKTKLFWKLESLQSLCFVACVTLCSCTVTQLSGFSMILGFALDQAFTLSSLWYHNRTVGEFFLCHALVQFFALKTCWSQPRNDGPFLMRQITVDPDMSSRIGHSIDPEILMS